MTQPDMPVEVEPPPFAPALVEECLRQLDKTVRARQLYLPNNPAYQAALAKLRASFAPLWAETDSLTLQITDTQFTWCGVSVHEHAAKASDSLPWLFYKDGLREITLTKGFETSEVEELLDVIPKVRRAQPELDDLITLLWELECEHLTYKYVDLAQEGTTALSPGPDAGRVAGAPPAPAAAVARDVRADAAAAPPPDRAGVVKLEDFDSTLYFLEQKEIDYITQEVEREYAADLRRIVLDALLDIFELQTDPAVRTEVLQHLEQMVLHLLAAGRLNSVAYLLRETAAIAQRVPALEAAHRDRLAALAGRLSDPATLTQILQQLDESSALPAQADLNELFGQLNASSLGTVFEWLRQIRTSQLRTLLEEAASRLAAANTGELVRLITQGRGDVLLQAIRRAGAMKATAAVGPIAKVLADTDRDARLAAVAALVEIASPGAMQTLERAVTDADRDIRIAAVRALGAGGQRSSLARIEGIVRSKEFRSYDLTERMAFFETYGQLCGDGGVPFLDGVLNGKSGLLGRREDPEYRACAAMALSHIKTQRALDALQRALSEKEPVVRNAVNRALRGAGGTGA